MYIVQSGYVMVLGGQSGKECLVGTLIVVYFMKHSTEGNSWGGLSIWRDSASWCCWEEQKNCRCRLQGREYCRHFIVLCALNFTVFIIVGLCKPVHPEEGGPGRNFEALS